MENLSNPLVHASTEHADQPSDASSTTPSFYSTPIPPPRPSSRRLTRSTITFHQRNTSPDGLDDEALGLDKLRVFRPNEREAFASQVRGSIMNIALRQGESVSEGVSGPNEELPGLLTLEEVAAREVSPVVHARVLELKGTYTKAKMLKEAAKKNVKGPKRAGNWRVRTFKPRPSKLRFFVVYGGDVAGVGNENTEQAFEIFGVSSARTMEARHKARRGFQRSTSN